MKSPKSLNLQRGLMKLGHPADCNPKKETVQVKKKKKGITKSKKKKEVSQTLSKKGDDCLFK